jgi:D-arabinose 5-phosphate isomerase GutQ
MFNYIGSSGFIVGKQQAVRLYNTGPSGFVVGK